ncbi:phage holin family protein [bacterium]|nr:phage holin family protein [bacterium]
MSWLLEVAFEFFIGGIAFSLVPLLVPGIRVDSFKSATSLVLFMSISNFFIAFLFKWVLWPLTILSLGLVRLVINGVILDFGSDLVSGVKVDSFKSAFLGALVLSILWTVLLWITKPIIGF